MMINERNKYKRIEQEIVREAEELSKSTGLTFRDCLEMLVKIDSTLNLDRED